MDCIDRSSDSGDSGNCWRGSWDEIWFKVSSSRCPIVFFYQERDTRANLTAGLARKQLQHNNLRLRSETIFQGRRHLPSALLTTQRSQTLHYLYLPLPQSLRRAPRPRLPPLPTPTALPTNKCADVMSKCAKGAVEPAIIRYCKSFAYGSGTMCPCVDACSPIKCADASCWGGEAAAAIGICGPGVSLTGCACSKS